MSVSQVGDAIRAHRKKLQTTKPWWTAAELADRVKMSAQYICDIELGRRIPPPSVVVDLGIVLDMDTTALMWLWLRDHVGDEMAEAMAESAPRPRRGEGE